MANTLKVESPDHTRVEDALASYSLSWAEYVKDRAYYIHTRYGQFTPEVKQAGIERYQFSLSELNAAWTELKSAMRHLKEYKKL